MKASEVYLFVVSMVLLMANFLLAMTLADARFEIRALREKYSKLRRRVFKTGVANLRGTSDSPLSPLVPHPSFRRGEGPKT